MITLFTATSLILLHSHLMRRDEYVLAKHSDDAREEDRSGARDAAE